MGYIPKEDDDKKKKTGGIFGEHADFPVYSSSSREKVVCELKCEVEDQKEKLFIAGVCFYLE